MKKILLLLLMLMAFLVTVPVFAGVTQDKEIKTLELPSDGRAKLGLLMGMPSGVTFGYRFSNWFEANVTAGYNFMFTKSALVSANGLFTLVNIPIGDAGVMPLSLGPQMNFIFGNDFYMDIVADLRLEYSFQDIPLNLFGEFGFGFRLFHDDWIAWNGGIGVRYIF